MQAKTDQRGLRVSLAALLLLGLGVGVAGATEPCGDFGECKVLIEINSTDGDIGFHFLMDGDDLLAARITDPNGAKIFEHKVKGALAEQKITETFAESAEPLCWQDPEADEDEEIVTLEEFLDRWTPGTYLFTGRSEAEGVDESEDQAIAARPTGTFVAWPATDFFVGEADQMSAGETDLSFNLPAAPAEVDFDGSVVSWMAGDDLGRCASAGELDFLAMTGVLPAHPEDVQVASFEVVLEPDVEDGDPTGSLVFSIRVPGDIWPMEVTVPADYLASLPADTPVKVEVGAIGVDDNATFTEEDGFCVNEDEGCDDD